MKREGVEPNRTTHDLLSVISEKVSKGLAKPRERAQERTGGMADRNVGGCRGCRVWRTGRLPSGRLPRPLQARSWSAEASCECLQSGWRQLSWR